MSGPRAGRRALAVAVGIFLVAIALAHREAFYSLPGVVLLLSGAALLLLSRGGPVGGGGTTFPTLVVLLCVVAALAPYDPAGINAVEAGLTLGAGVLFLGLSSWRRRLLPSVAVPAGLLLLAQAHYLLRFPHPVHQDVWTFLNIGADMLGAGHSPYLGVHFVEAGIAKSVPYTYPPGALVVLSPFRWLLSDVRWAYIVAEAVVVGAWVAWLHRGQRLDRARAALILVPLVLPRTSQAFFIFSNHEWELLALALGALLLLARGREVAAGICLGIGIASKQYFVIYPLVFLTAALRRRAVLAAAVTATALVLPFLAWTPGAFLLDVFGNLSQAPDPERLTLWATLHHYGFVLPRLALVALSATALVGGIAAAWVTRRDLPRSLQACGLSLLAFAFCASFAAYNYYAYGLVLFTWGAILHEDPQRAVPLPA